MLVISLPMRIEMLFCFVVFLEGGVDKVKDGSSMRPGFH